MIAIGAVQTVSWPLVALLAWRAARGRVGWIAWPTAVAVGATAIMALGTETLGTGALVAATVQNIAVSLLVYGYPDGRFWPRWVWAPLLGAIVLQLADLVSGFRLSGQAWWPLQFLLWTPCIVVALWMRYARRTDAAGRRSVRWVLTGLVVMVAVYLVWWMLAISLSGGDTGPSWLSGVLLTLPWLAAAVGLLWPDAVVVDPILRWTLALGVFATVCAVSIAVVSALGASAAVTAWLAGGVLAVCAVPLWTGLSRLADRLVYGRRQDVLTALGDLDDMLAAGHDAGEVPHTIVRTVARAIMAERCELRGLDGILLAKAGAAISGLGTPGPAGFVAGAAEDFPIVYRGDVLATVRVWPRRGEQRLTSDDRAVVARVCAYGGPALDGARALVELVDSRARTVLAREEERKRLRRDLHDDLAPTFAGLGLTASALERFAADGDPRARTAARDLTASLSSATRQLREIAYDLRPPALDDRGLAAALHDRLVFAGTTPVVTIRAELSAEPLPAAVEAAAFRIAQEAVMNVRRHAAAAHCDLTITVEHGGLRLRVADDGIGTGSGASGGVGLRSMRERAEELGGSFRIDPAAHHGTVVEVYLPTRATRMDVER